MRDRTQTGIPCKLDTNLDKQYMMRYVDREFIPKCQQVAMVPDESFETRRMDVESYDVGAKFVKGGEVVAELFGVLI
jgi:hypothetical protein